MTSRRRAMWRRLFRQRPKCCVRQASARDGSILMSSRNGKCEPMKAQAPPCSSRLAVEARDAAAINSQAFCRQYAPAAEPLAKRDLLDDLIDNVDAKSRGVVRPFNRCRRAAVDAAAMVQPAEGQARALSASQRVRLQRNWTVGRCRRTQLLQMAPGLSAMCYDFDRAQLASGSSDGRVRLWDLTQSPPQARVLGDHLLPVYSVALSPGASALVSAAYDKTWRSWDLTQKPPQAQVFRGRSDVNNAVSFSCNGSQLINATLSPDGSKRARAASNDGRVQVWDLTKDTVQVLEGHHGLVKALSFSATGTRLASGSEDSTVCVWDLTQKRPPTWVLEVRSPVNAVALSSDGTKLA
ncbi:MAG: hypothetical protein EOO40_04995, partial [Deltaproteobacteria bacterium]